MKKLIDKIDECMEILKDHSTLASLFSKNEGVRTLAQLYQTIGRIKYLARISEVKQVSHPKNKPVMELRDTGKFVRIKPCSDKYEGKTYLGILIGHIATGSTINIEKKSVVCSWAGYNPAILIPELKKVVYGCESWWRFINSEDDLSEITDIDVDNVWYVKALKQLANAK